MKMTLQQAMLHRSVKGSRRYVYLTSRIDQHTAERLVVVSGDLLLLKLQLKYDEMIATIEEKLSQR